VPTPQQVAPWAHPQHLEFARLNADLRCFQICRDAWESVLASILMQREHQPGDCEASIQAMLCLPVKLSTCVFAVLRRTLMKETNKRWCKLMFPLREQKHYLQCKEILVTCWLLFFLDDMKTELTGRSTGSGALGRLLGPSPSSASSVGCLSTAGQLHATCHVAIEYPHFFSSFYNISAYAPGRHVAFCERGFFCGSLREGMARLCINFGVNRSIRWLPI
jgi:hypothetical protein